MSQPTTPESGRSNPCGKPTEPCGEFAALRQANLARAREWNPDSVVTGPGFAGLELAGEVGELCNLLKKAERARLGLVGGSVSPEAIAQELADVVICADLVGIALGLDLWPIVVAKFNATSDAKGFATRLRAAIPLSVARFKEAGHPATADGEAATCGLCGEPMPPGEEMFAYHGLRNPCPKPPLAQGGGA